MSSPFRIDDRLTFWAGWVTSSPAVSSDGVRYQAVGTYGIEIPSHSSSTSKRLHTPAEASTAILESLVESGWSQIFWVDFYHTDLAPDASSTMTSTPREYVPHSNSIWTDIEVGQLAAPVTHAEIDVLIYGLP